ncbi:MAG: leucine-rich repeat domain-containing protein [Paludibacter sp.]
MNMRTVIISLVILFCFNAFSQNTPLSSTNRQNATHTLANFAVNFDKKYYECENKWVITSQLKDSSNYIVGFVYLDNTAGYTLNLEGELQMDSQGNIISLKKQDNTNRIIYRLGKNSKSMAQLPQQEITNLSLNEKPEWLKIYQETDEIKHDVISAKHLNAQGYYERAILLLEKHQQLKPHPENLDFELGFAYNALLQFDKAIGVLETGLKINSKDVLLYKELGFAFLCKGEFDKAMSLYKKGVLVATENQLSIKAEIAFNMAMVYKQKLKNEKEFQYWANKASNWSNSLSTIPKILAESGYISKTPADTAYLDKANNIAFNDKVLETRIKKELGFDLEKPVNVKDVENITSLLISGSFKEPNQPKIKNIDALKYFKNLERLEARYHSIKSVKPLSNLRKLRSIFLQNNEVNNISPLAELTELEVLELYMNNVTDLSPVQKMNKLRELNIFQNNVRRIEPLKNLVELRSLNMGYNFVTDIKPLQNLLKLQTLWLYNNPVRNIELIASLKNSIRTLSLANCKINDISFLKDFRNLQTLLIFDNPIDDLTPIRQLYNLQTLSVNNCELTDLEVIVHLAKNNAFQNLKEKFKYQLDLSGNPIDYENKKNKEDWFYLKQSISKSNF